MMMTLKPALKHTPGISYLITLSAIIVPPARHRCYRDPHGRCISPEHHVCVTRGLALLELSLTAEKSKGSAQVPELCKPWRQHTSHIQKWNDTITN
jgi:hypothetical protein